MDLSDRMSGPSYSAWFLRFLAAFNGSARGRDGPDGSHEAWMATFAESFRGEEAAKEILLDWESHEDEDFEGHSDTGWTSYGQSQTRQAEEKPRYRQMGGEDDEQ